MKLPAFSLPVLGLLGVLVTTGCDRSTPETGGKPVVFASVAPVAGLAKRIAGDRVAVETLAGPEQDPHGFSPTPKQLVALGDSEGFFVVGMPFERRLIEKLKGGTRDLRIVDLGHGIERLELDEHHHHDHGDGHGHEHEHEEAEQRELGDPHLWLSPALLKKQAILIEHTLHDIDPAGHDVFHANLEKLLADLDALDEELKTALAPLAGQSFYVFHGAFAYFAQAYGLKQEAIEVGGRSPEPKRIFALIEQAKAEGIRLIIVQPQFDTHSAEAIADGIGGAVVPVNPVGEDVFETLRTLATHVKAARGQ